MISYNQILSLKQFLDEFLYALKVVTQTFQGLQEKNETEKLLLMQCKIFSRLGDKMSSVHSEQTVPNGILNMNCTIVLIVT